MKNKTNMAAMLLLIFGILLNFTACKKEVAGPAGPQGPKGNANVLSTTYAVSAWTYSAPDYTASIGFYAITQDIMDKGCVQVYLKGSGGEIALPYTAYVSNQYSTTFSYEASLGKVTLYITDSDLTQPNNPGLLTFKIVAIAASARIPSVNHSNYSEVKAAYNLPD